MRNRVAAEAEIVATQGANGVTRLPVLKSQAPLVLRRAREAVYLVSAAAGPLGGDQLNLRITVRAGSALCLRTVAASVALPGLDGGESLLTVTATVEEGGCLDYLPEPVVVADGARHATDVRVTLASGARLLLREELILGRHGERGGGYRGRLHVDYAGRPLLRQCLEVDGSDAVSRGPAVLSDHRAVGTLLRVDESLATTAALPTDPNLPTASALTAAPAAGLTAATPGPAPSHEPTSSPWVAVMPLASGPATLTTALARDALGLRELLHAQPVSSGVP
jgi:urease accessory protein